MAARKRTLRCRHPDCTEQPFLGGLCKVHHEEQLLKDRRRRDAVAALHSCTVDGTLLEDSALREEVLRLASWWQKACLAAQHPTYRDPILDDEAQYAIEWCIRLSEQIVEAQRALRLGQQVDEVGLSATRNWVWERFAFLEQGLRSNGTKRSAA